MKTLMLSSLAVAALLSLSACEADGDHRRERERSVQTTTTTTEESTIRTPVGATTETRTTRTYCSGEVPVC